MIVSKQVQQVQGGSKSKTLRLHRSNLTTLSSCRCERVPAIVEANIYQTQKLKKLIDTRKRAERTQWSASIHVLLEFGCKTDNEYGQAKKTQKTHQSQSPPLQFEQIEQHRNPWSECRQRESQQARPGQSSRRVQPDLHWQLTMATTRKKA